MKGFWASLEPSVAVWSSMSAFAPPAPPQGPASQIFSLVILTRLFSLGWRTQIYPPLPHRDTCWGWCWLCSRRHNGLAWHIVDSRSWYNQSRWPSLWWPVLPTLSPPPTSCWLDTVTICSDNDSHQMSKQSQWLSSQGKLIKNVNWVGFRMGKHLALQLTVTFSLTCSFNHWWFDPSKDSHWSLLPDHHYL